MTVADDRNRARAEAEEQKDPVKTICPDCDGTGWHYSNEWPYRQDRVTCYRCRGDLVVRKKS